MTTDRPPVHLTTRALTLGSLSAAGLLAAGLLLDVVGQSDAGTLVGNIGVLVLLLTPVASLVATWFELRVPRPAHAWIAVAVLLVLVLATAIALLARP